MRISDKLRKLLFLMMLGFGTAMGAPIDPKEIEDTLRLMNGPQVELVLPAKDEPKPPPPHLTDGTNSF
jgi:hypothetical protein